MEISIPSWIDWPQLTHKGNSTIKAFNSDHLAMMLNLFIDLPMRDDKLVDKEGFMALHSKKLEGFLYRYRVYLNFLRDEKIIDERKHYIPGEKSRGFKLFIPTDLKQKYLQPIQLKSNCAIKKRKQRCELPKTLRFFEIWITSMKINTDEALDYTNNYFREQMLIEKYKVNCIAKLRSKRVSAENAIFLIQREHFFYSIDTTAGRLHHNLTNIKKELRQFITIGDKQLVGLDIKNAQPFMILKLLTKAFWVKKKQDRIWRQRITNIGTLIMFVEELQSTHIEEFSAFKTSVCDGSFYELFSSEYKVLFGQDLPRDQAKQSLIVFLFDKHRPNSKQGQVMRSLFPTVLKIIALIKEAHHNSLAILLQSIESDLILHSVCKTLSRKYPLMPIVPVHDSIYTVKEHLIVLRETMMAETFKIIGHYPQLSECN